MGFLASVGYDSSQINSLPILIKSITKEEVSTTLKESRKQRTLGSDGIPTEFFCTFVDIVIPLLTHMFQEEWHVGQLPLDILQGDITLIPKLVSGSTLEINDQLLYQSIFYKIFTKLWPNRLTKVTQATISWNHTTFLPCRLIHHSMMLCDEVINHIL